MSQGGARLKWITGGEGDLLSVTPDAIEIRSTVPAPPGSRMEGSVESPRSGAIRLQVKVHASRRESGGGFLLRGRPVDLRREAREALLLLLQG